MSTTPEPDVAAFDPTRVRIFDTTLRDGEQSPGASMNLNEKLEVARALAALGVRVLRTTPMPCTVRPATAEAQESVLFAEVSEP